MDIWNGTINIFSQPKIKYVTNKYMVNLYKFFFQIVHDQFLKQ